MQHSLCGQRLAKGLAYIRRLAWRPARPQKGQHLHVLNCLYFGDILLSAPTIRIHANPCRSEGCLPWSMHMARCIVFMAQTLQASSFMPLMRKWSSAHLKASPLGHGCRAPLQLCKGVLAVQVASLTWSIVQSQGSLGKDCERGVIGVCCRVIASKAYRFMC